VSGLRIGALLSCILLLACNRSDTVSERVHLPLSTSPQEHLVQPPLTNMHSDIDLTLLSDAPPLPGTCLGWQRSLAQGNLARETAVARCLINTATINRSQALRDATILSTWKIKGRSQYPLELIARTLRKFPEDGELYRYLKQLGLLTGAGLYQSNDTEAPLLLTAYDYIETYGKVYAFDVETGTFPNNHDYLLEFLAELSESKLRSATFVEHAPKHESSNEEDYLLTANFNHKQYQLAAKNYGDWYDVNAVLQLLNTVAIDNQIPERFVHLPTTDQISIVAVLNHKALIELVEQGLFEFQEKHPRHATQILASPSNTLSTQAPL